MTHHIFELLRDALAQYGYWALGAILLLENMGIPVPGETILLLASFLAYSHGELQLGWIIVVGTIASTVGDNLGYAIGHRGGRPLLEKYQRFFRISPQALAKGDQLFSRYGAVTVLFSRFVFGLRIIAGPLAGVLRMPWKRFAIFNFLGAALWVSVIATVGYLFGRHWERFEHELKIADIVIVAAAVLGIAFFWWRNHRKRAG